MKRYSLKLRCTIHNECDVNPYHSCWLHRFLITSSPTRLLQQQSAPSCLVVVWLCHRHKPTKLAHSFLFCSCVCFCLYGPFSSISFHKFSRQLFAFTFCSFGLNSALLVLSTLFLFMKVSFGPDIIPSGWLGFKRQLIYKHLSFFVVCMQFSVFLLFFCHRWFQDWSAKLHLKPHESR